MIVRGGPAAILAILLEPYVASSPDVGYGAEQPLSVHVSALMMLYGTEVVDAAAIMLIMPKTANVALSSERIAMMK